jgi:hypothetical protein
MEKRTAEWWQQSDYDLATADYLSLTDVIYDQFAPVEALAMTPEEWERGDSFVVDFARNGEVLYAA